MSVELGTPSKLMQWSLSIMDTILSPLTGFFQFRGYLIHYSTMLGHRMVS